MRFTLSNIDNFSNGPGVDGRGGGASYTPKLDFSDARNSMYLFFLLVG